MSELKDLPKVLLIYLVRLSYLCNNPYVLDTAQIDMDFPMILTCTIAISVTTKRPMEEDWILQIQTIFSYSWRLGFYST